VWLAELLSLCLLSIYLSLSHHWRVWAAFPVGRGASGDAGPTVMTVRPEMFGLDLQHGQITLITAMF
jgi:hypothetical protein